VGDRSIENEIYTIGHSSRQLESFTELLEENGIELLADVRRFPGSRRYPHFNAGALNESLSELGIAYRHFEALGGRRGKPADDSPSRGWRVEAFAAYADFMGTDEFRTALHELEQEARQRRTAIMCAEAVPWRCHRRLIADALTVRGWRVYDIMDPGKTEPHELTHFARVHDGRLTYPADADLFDEQDPGAS